MSYPPPPYSSDDREKMLDLIRNYPLATLISAKDDRAFATHIPIIYNEETQKLVAHIDIYNPQVETLVDGAMVKVVFKGPDCYISPSVYSTDQLPTWNYMIVYVDGTVSRINDAESAKRTMIDMTAFLEGPEPGFVLENDNPKMERSVNYIQAFTIDIHTMDGRFKLSQDKKPEDRRRARQALIAHSRPQEKDFIDRIYNSARK